MDLRHARRLVIAVIGGTVLMAGVLMLVTPGPGILTILAGLAVLATEFIWAARVLKRAREHADGAHEGLKAAWRQWCGATNRPPKTRRCTPPPRRWH